MIRPEQYPIRQRSANGLPRPSTSIERTCRQCRASFRGLAPGKTGERGIWREARGWYCSAECEDRAVGYDRAGGAS